MYIILPVHNRRALTVGFAEALGRQTWPHFTLLLVDDGSRDGTADAVRAILPQTVVLSGNGDWWWAGALQQAWLWLKQSPPEPGAIIGICNDDMGVEDDFLACAVRELADHPDTLLLAREQDEVTGQEQGGGVAADLKHLRFVPCRDATAINCLPTRGLFFRWKDFERIGGFYPRLLPHYLSDYEFTLRAGRRGLRLAVAKTFAIRSRRLTTGLAREDLLRAPRWRRPGLIFSRRFKENPFAWSGFVVLAVPGWRCPWLLLKIWANTVCLLAGSLLPPLLHSHD